MKEKAKFIPSLETCLDILFEVMRDDALDNEKRMIKEIRERLGWMVINRRKLEKALACRKPNKPE